MIIDGKKIAEEIIEELKKQPKPKKFLGAFLAVAQDWRTSPDEIGRGGDPASLSFVKQKGKTARGLGIDFRVYKFPEKITQDELRDEILKIVSHKTCGGVVIQLPLPSHINAQFVLNVISREKDVDVLGERALGAFYAGRNPVLPPAVGTVDVILSKVNCHLSNVTVAVVGLGALVGKPVTTWLMGKAKEIYLLDKGSDFGVLKSADIIISGAGIPGLIKPEMLKENAIVIDFGYSIGEDGKISGNLDVSSSKVNKPMKLKAIHYTPTPGGTGPILVAKLFENFYKLAQG